MPEFALDAGAGAQKSRAHFGDQLFESIGVDAKRRGREGLVTFQTGSMTCPVGQFVQGRRVIAGFAVELLPFGQLDQVLAGVVERLVSWSMHDPCAGAL
ncbi:hypothetical protein D3C85_1624630 [compost metagenome]